MKTMKKSDEVVRVSEEDVNTFLKKGYVFCPKSMRKNKNVKVKVTVESPVEVVEAKKPKKVKNEMANKKTRAPRNVR